MISTLGAIFPAMRIVVSTLLCSAATLLVVGCGGGTGISSAGSSNPGYGPFDRNGNYVEEWADKPAKKHWWARKAPDAPVTKEVPAVAKVTPKPERKPTPTRSTEVASLSRNYTPPAPARSYTPPKPKPIPTYTPPRPAPTYTPPKPTVYTPPPAPKPKPVPKPVPVKPKAPPPIRHVVVKGDTLYNISQRHNTSVSSIQRANGISGTTIRLGQTLVIPRS